MRIDLRGDWPSEDSGDSHGAEHDADRLDPHRENLEYGRHPGLPDVVVRPHSAGMMPLDAEPPDPFDTLAAVPASPSLAGLGLVGHVEGSAEGIQEDEAMISPVVLTAENQGLKALELLLGETIRRGGIEAGGDVNIFADQGIVAGSIGQLTYQVPNQRSKPVRLPLRPPYLAGREGLLDDLSSRLTLHCEDRSLRIVVLHGLGGVAKTSVAVEYAYRHAADLNAVWYFAAENPVAMAAGFADLAAGLGVSARSNSGNPVAAVHSSLAVRPGGWLLIFDNASVPLDLAATLPPTGQGAVIITSQNPFWQGMDRIEVQVVSTEAAAAFLLRNKEDAVPLDWALAVILAGELGCLPLALAQADAYMEVTGRGLGDYLRLYKERRAEMHDRGDAPGYDKRVATTWSLALDFIKGTALGATALLQLLSCFAPDDIPVRVLLRPHSVILGSMPTPVRSALELLEPLMKDQLVADQAVTALRRFSLISSPAGGSVSMHRLVQTVTLDSLESQEPGQTEAWRAAAGVLVETALTADPTDRRSWESYSGLASHVPAVLPPASPAACRTAAYLGYSGRPAAARDLLESVAIARQEEFGRGHPDTLTARGQLAYWTGRAGDAAAAWDQFADLVPELVRVLGADHPDTLTGRTNLARWTGQAGDVAAAREQYADLVPELVRVLGVAHLDTLAIRDCLARSTGQAGNPVEARDLYAELVGDLEQIRGKDDDMTRFACRSLARWSRAAREHQESNPKGKGSE